MVLNFSIFSHIAVILVLIRLMRKGYFSVGNKELLFSYRGISMLSLLLISRMILFEILKMLLFL